MIRHVLLAYGAEHEYQRAIFSIFSFWAWFKNREIEVQTLVFTDNPNAFNPCLVGLPVEYRQLNRDDLEAMYGPYRYIHRAKIAIVEQVFNEYPLDSLLFCDADTYFIADPTPLLRRLRPGNSLMHLREYRYTRAIPKWATPEYAAQIQTGVDLIESRTYRVGGSTYQFSKHQYMYNSGVLGLTPEVARLLPDIYELTDTLHGNHRWIVSEQVAFSLALPTATSLLCSNRYVFHYWNKVLKTSMDVLLKELMNQDFINGSLSDQLTAVKRVTKKWPGKIVFQMAKNDVIQDFSSGSILDAIRSSLRVTRDVCYSPYKLAFALNLLRSLRSHRRITVNTQISSK